MLPGYFIIATFILRLLGSASYIRAIIRGQAQPNLLSWFLWSATPMIAFYVAVRSDAGIAALGTLALALSTALVLVVALWRRAGVMTLDPANIACGLLSVIGIALWQITSDPYIAIITAILADIASAIPTIRKLIARPWTEYAPTYMLSAVAMVIALLTVKEWSFTSTAFIAYTMTINCLFVAMISFFGSKRKAP